MRMTFNFNWHIKVLKKSRSLWIYKSMAVEL